MIKGKNILILGGYKDDADASALLQGLYLRKEPSISITIQTWSDTESFCLYLLGQDHNDRSFLDFLNFDIVIISPYVQLGDQTIPNYTIAKLCKQRCLEDGFTCPRTILSVYKTKEELPTSAQLFETYLVPKSPKKVWDIIKNGEKPPVVCQFALINTLRRKSGSLESYAILESGEIIRSYEKVESKYTNERTEAVHMILNKVVPTLRIFAAQGRGDILKIYDIAEYNKNIYHILYYMPDIGWDSWMRKRFDDHKVESCYQIWSQHQTILNQLFDFALEIMSKVREKAEATIQ